MSYILLANFEVGLICAKKWFILFLSELCQISTKFDNFWHADIQGDRIM